MVAVADAVRDVVAAALGCAVAPATGAHQPATRPATSRPAVDDANPHKMAHELAKGPGGQLAAVVALEAAAGKYADGPMRDMWLDVLATRLIFVGDHKKAAELNTKAYAAMRPKGAVSDGAELKGYEPRPAVETIVKLAEGRRVLMLNEEHRSSRERAFAHELLEPLRQAGFTHLALETIDNAEAVTDRKYPLAGDGFYTNDPILADLVRRAAEMGMGIVQYEADFEEMPKDLDPNDPTAQTNWRERKQAENLAAFLKANPEARLIVWSGRHHMSEDEAGEAGQDAGPVWTPMGGIFRTLTGIDPLTVDLMVLNEMAAPEAEHRTYRWAVEQGLVTGPTVFVNDEGRPWTPLAGAVDAGVFFPRTEWTRGRPAWLEMGGVRLGIRTDLSQSLAERPAPGRPLVVEARLAEEAADAVPLDRVIWREGEFPPLFVRLGYTYEIVVKDPEGKVLASVVAPLPRRAS